MWFRAQRDESQFNFYNLQALTHTFSLRQSSNAEKPHFKAQERFLFIDLHGAKMFAGSNFGAV